jgi:signal peptidase I
MAGSSSDHATRTTGWMPPRAPWESRPVPTTALLGLVYVVMVVFQVLSSAWLLRLGARWVGAGAISDRRAILAVLLMAAVDLVVRIPVLYGSWVAFRGYPELYRQAGAVAAMVLSFVAMLGVSQKILRTGPRKAILAWLPTLLAWVAALGLAEGVIRPYLFEPFVVTDNSMAPTILGRHVIGQCPSCGGVAYVPAASRDVPSPREGLGICGRCLRASTITAAGDEVSSGDRVVVARFLRPRRWDLLVFFGPEDPTIPYVKRVVGLPGDRLAIHDGDVWIDGKRAEKPPDISTLVYLARPTAEPAVSWGPVRLAPGEYFVLDDFSRISRDSRVWSTGATGYPPFYAVPESSVIGVVTHTYWPPRRWRIFR